MSVLQTYDLYHPEPLLIILSGVSCSGKDSVVKELKKRGIDFHFIVTATSRPRRPNEEDGVDYHFLQKSEFERMIACNEFVEYSEVYGDYKGVPRSEIEPALSSGKDLIMRVDVQGVAKLKKVFPEAVLIFLTVPSEADLIKRMEARGSETRQQVDKRIRIAREELKRIGEFDYVVVNRAAHLDEAVDTVTAIIKAEHHRVHHRKVTL